MTEPAPRKSLLFVTGTRADFGKIEPLVLAARDAGHEITLFVTGMHLLQKYGHTVLEVRRVKGVNFYEFINQSPGDPQDLILTKTISGFSDMVKDAQPDLVIVHGDRVEAFGAAIVCATNYVPCAHIEGGEVSGTIDEVYRHCISKLCRYHFVSSETARRRVMTMGEADEDVFPIGSPELDVHRAPSTISLEQVKRRYQIAFEEYGIVSFHPVTSEIETIGRQARDLFDALTATGRQFVVISPNNDPGSDAIFEVIHSLPKAQFRHIPSLRFSYFSELMRNASAIIGNSSLGVREAPFLGVPSLNLGTRQSNRALAASTVHCACSDRAAIEGFIAKHWGRRVPKDQGFGSGNAAAQFLEILDQPGFWQRPIQKVFHD